MALKDIVNATVRRVGKTNRGDLRFYGDPVTGEIWIQSLGEPPGDPNVDERYGSKREATVAMERFLDKLLTP